MICLLNNLNTYKLLVDVMSCESIEMDMFLNCLQAIPLSGN